RQGSDASELTVTKANSDPLILMTREESALLDIVVSNEWEPVTYVVTNPNGLSLTQGQTLGPDGSGQQQVRYQINGLTHGSTEEISITVNDAAGSSRTTRVY